MLQTDLLGFGDPGEKYFHNYLNRKILAKIQMYIMLMQIYFLHSSRWTFGDRCVFLVKTVLAKKKKIAFGFSPTSVPTAAEQGILRNLLRPSDLLLSISASFSSFGDVEEGHLGYVTTFRTVVQLQDQPHDVP